MGCIKLHDISKNVSIVQVIRSHLLKWMHFNPTPKTLLSYFIGSKQIGIFQGADYFFFCYFYAIEGNDWNKTKSKYNRTIKAKYALRLCNKSRTNLIISILKTAHTKKRTATREWKREKGGIATTPCTKCITISHRDILIILFFYSFAWMSAFE